MTELYIALESGEPTPIQPYLPGAPPQLVAFFARALCRDPRGRFQSTAEMAAALAALPLVASAPNANQTQMTGGAWSQPAPLPTQHTGVTAYPVAVAAPTGPGMPPTYPAPIAPGGAVASTGPAPIHSTVNVAPLVVPPAGSSAKTWIALGLALVAVGLIVTAVVIAKRDARAPDVAIVDPKPVPEKHVVDDQGQDIVVKPVDPPPEPPPPPPPQKKPVVPPPPPEKKPAVAPPPPEKKPAVPPPSGEPTINGLTREGFCGAACNQANSCGLGANNCMQLCVFNQESVDCFQRAGTCNGFAGCVFNTMCHAPPSGGLSCGQAFTCMTGCNGDNGCACNCASQMSINHAQLLLRLYVCVVGCGGAQECIQNRCAQITAQCLQQ